MVGGTFECFWNGGGGRAGIEQLLKKEEGEADLIVAEPIYLTYHVCDDDGGKGQHKPLE